MNVTTDAEAPPYTITDIKHPPGSHDYLFVVGFFLTAIVLFTITYVSYKFKRSRPPPPPDTAGEDADDHNLIRFSRGLDHEVLVTFPMSVYSEMMIDAGNVANGSGCSICLADYMPPDVVRILPECGHLFHVGCVDTWLKSNPTCPVCRNSQLHTCK
ncbi:hypothetical protein SSX86_018552 [Deinandra increscens subsp. villosa]|uniref:RING-type domain-containing protein n=1 Tax=Deinandra increscens subsp. villosa TaxID=3103831 RepID=A0AAP0CSK2_9ASTR